MATKGGASRGVHYSKAEEKADFPILCETCLGPNPYIRMMRNERGEECRICERPCTIFRWRPGRDARYKVNIICQTCARVKNVCQTCMFDLEFGLPVQVRDAFTPNAEQLEIPKSVANREWFTAHQEKHFAAGGLSAYETKPNTPEAQQGQRQLSKLARVTPYYKRNRAHVCSFFVKGCCTRGEECPYRHELPEQNELSFQNIKDRYYGVNDPVADKLMRRAEAMPKIEPPADVSITTLYVGGVDPAAIVEKDLRDHFYQFGEIRTIHCVPRQTCAFVEFVSRDSAQRAMSASHGKLVINGLKLRVLWGRGQATGKQFNEGGVAPALAPSLAPVPGLPGAVPIPASYAAAAAAGGLPGHPGAAVHYPSMDPMRMGTHAPRPRPDAPQ